MAIDTTALEEQFLTASDDEKASILAELYKNAINSDFDLVFDYAARMQSLGERLNDKAIEGKASHWYGSYYLKKGTFEEALHHYQKGMGLFEQVNDEEGQVSTLTNMAIIFEYSGDLSDALDYYLRALKLAEKLNNSYSKSLIYTNMGVLYLGLKKPHECEEYLKKGLSLKQELNDIGGLASSYGNLGNLAFYLKNYDEAEELYKKALEISKEAGHIGHNITGMCSLSDVYLIKEDYKKALELCEEAWQLAKSHGLNFEMVDSQIKLANAKLVLGDLDEAQELGEESLAISKEFGINIHEIASYELLSRIFETKNIHDQALKFYKAYTDAQQKMVSEKVAKRIGLLQTIFETEKKEQEAEIYRLKNTELKQALDNLKKTKEQLINQERLATIGQLAAGIAHEIQNPLNFVNNFSGLNVELVNEIREDILNDTGLTDEQKLEEIEDILNDVEQNAQKIVEHGKRADNIIRQMLLHSRGKKDDKSLANLNELVKDNLLLAFHGMRAQNIEFSATYEEKLDINLPKVNVVPQDISRVFLNLIGNAFHAVNKKHAKGDDPDYVPLVTITTQPKDGCAVITIRDNGHGIPKELQAQIFEPFFTTKPSGEGTGLGLSISHDVVENMHQGKLEVHSEEGVYTEFTVTLPC